MATSTRSIQKNVWTATECLSSTIPGKRKVLSVECDGESLVYLEQMYDRQSELIYEQRHPISFVVGSGQRAKAYLLQVNDLLFMSPLNWYRQSESWDLAPNYQEERNGCEESQQSSSAFLL